MLADRAILGNPTGPSQPLTRLFDPGFWADRGQLESVTLGRGSAWFIANEPQQWALRHYRRGGFIARFSKDQYLWGGEERVRAFAEWRLLRTLVQLGLPVPTPVAAGYARHGFLYRCDLITQRIVGGEPLSVTLTRAPLAAGLWRQLGATIARFHVAGVDHADLNAHNILMRSGNGETSISVIDFDRGVLRAPGGWSLRNLARLQRSLMKITRVLPADRFSPASWELFLAGYA